MVLLKLYPGGIYRCAEESAVLCTQSNCLILDSTTSSGLVRIKEFCVIAVL